MDKDRVGPALGRISSGLYIATATVDKEPIGMLCSFVEQASFAPPMVTIALSPDRRVAQAAREKEGGLIGLNILSTENNSIIGPFANPNNENPFKGLELVPNDYQLPQIEDALAFLICSFRQDIPAGDHHIYLFEVVDGDLMDGDLEPMTRVRRNGFNY